MPESYQKMFEEESCLGCKHNQAGRWTGAACRIGVPGDDEDYSCKTRDPDETFWIQQINQPTEKTV